jgi:hypothetical protein
MDPDPTPDPTSFFRDFKDAKKCFFHIFFLITYPQAHYLQSSKFNFLPNFCSTRSTPLFEKDPEPDPNLGLMDPDPGGPKT